MRLDCHNHAVPHEAIDLLNAESAYGVEIRDGRWLGGNHVEFDLPPSFHDPAAKLAQLAGAGLDGAVVSAAPPLFYYELERGPAEAMCEAVNAGLERMAGHDPGRLRWLAHVPMQAPRRAAEMLEVAAGRAGCAGVEIGTSIDGRRLDEPEFEPFWATVERLGLGVLVHPDLAYETYRPLGDYYLGNVIGFPLETTIAAERLICAGVLDRHPGLRILLVHAGGYFPYQAGRLRHAATVRPELAGAPPDPWAYVGRLWFDVIAHDRRALRYLLDRVGADHVVMGTDLPFDMALADPVARVVEAADEATAERVAVDNPARLFAAAATRAPAA